MRLSRGLTLSVLCVLAPLVPMLACVGEDPGITPSGEDGGGTPGEGGADSPTNEEGGTCNAPKTKCGSACVDTTNDSAHCGACDKSCGGATCFEGVCNGQKVKAVAAATNAACALRESGSVWCWGANGKTELGAKNLPSETTCENGTKCSVVPVRVEGLPKITKISGGFEAFCAVAVNGDVFCWGRNQANILGKVPVEVCGSEACVVKPTKMPNMPPATDVVLSLSTTCVRTLAQEIYCLGTNEWGQLGPGASTDVGTPNKVALPGGVLPASIVIGGSQKPQVCALAGNTAFYCWGATPAGEIRNPNEAEDCTAGKCVKAPYSLPVLGTVDQVIAGAGHTCTRGGGVVKCWGFAGYGIGSGSATPRTIAELAGSTEISGRGVHLCGRKDTGQILCLGHSTEARLGLKEETAGDPGCVLGPCRSTPVTVPGANALGIDSLAGTNVAIRFDGAVVAWGGNRWGMLGHAPATGTDLSCPSSGTPSTFPCQPAPQAIPSLP